ncbi:hypothetical protein ACF05T_26265 [Streptomyces lateritius]|uniref:Uncharacterized protein n=1 Tax=Streptomyces lateritius TaxID=67313 RepID=A0ABW6YII8_9ACTN
METAEPVTGDHPTEPGLPLLTAAGARGAGGHVRLLETLDLTPRGPAADQLARGPGPAYPLGVADERRAAASTPAPPARGGRRAGRV